MIISCLLFKMIKKVKRQYLHYLAILVFLKVFFEEAFNSVVWYHTGFTPVIASKAPSLK